jgi:hypothetical protein
MKFTAKLVRISRLLVATAVLSVCNAAQAQDTAPAPPPPGPDVFYRTGVPIIAAEGSDDAMVFVGFEGELGGKTVTGAPFSANFSTQTKQVLADGNQILRTNTGSFARDSQGRTRRDMTFPGIGLMAAGNQVPPHVVMINDPVAGSQYVLEVDRRIARKMQIEQGRKHGRRGENRAAITLRGRAESNVTTVSLGTQTINGVLAEGTRTTRTIPAGAIGNTNPIVITVERWYSPDLQTVVMMKRDDPRMGETTFQLTNIQRQEPDASLFEVPSDYAVKQGRGERLVRRMAPPPDAGAAGPPASPQN